MIDIIAEPETTEAFKTLLSRMGRRALNIPAEVLVRHVLTNVPAEEWPVRSEAMDALLRRLDSVKRDELRIAASPTNGRRLGLYATRRRGSNARPYDTIVAGVDPIEGRCNCPDFLKNSLGLCKHILTVLETLYSRPRPLKQAQKEQASQISTAAQPDASPLRWNPIRPLTGAGDWLERITWSSSVEPKGARAHRITRARKWFRRGDAGNLVLKQSFRADPEKRLTLIQDLIGALPYGAAARAVSHDPALRALLAAEQARLQRLVTQAPTHAQVRSALKQMKRTLYPYQREGVDRFLAAGHLLLADDMGLGKTAQAISAVEVLWRSGRVSRGLIIAPASLKPQWAREWTQFSHLPITVIDGNPNERKAVYDTNKTGLFIINYEQLIRDLDVIRRWKPDLVVLDEAQRIKNWATKTALSVKGLAPPYRLVLTGTPMENRVEELASIVEWVDDMALEPKWRLGAVHAVRADGRKEVVGVRHLETLRERLRPCLVRRIRQDVLDQLPPRTDTRVPVEMTDEQLDEHDALNQPIASILQRANTRPLTQAEFLKLITLLTTQRIISNGLCQLRFESIWPAIRGCAPEESVIKGLSAPKLLELRQLIRQLVLEQGRKIVVFSQWRRMLSLAHWAISDLLAGDDLRAGFFTGAEGPRRRTQNIVEFHDDPRFRLLLASDAGGVGLNLQHASNGVINLELPWNPAVLEQRIGRVYRLGQKKPIDVFNLVSEQGIEARIATIVDSKQAFFKGLFDGESDAVRFDQSASFLSRVQALYAPSINGGNGTAPSPTVDGDETAATEPTDSETDTDIDIDIDDTVADPLEPVLDAADESRDLVPVPAEAPVPSPAPTERASPTSATESAAPSPATSAATSSPADIRALFSRLQIQRQPDGRVLIEADAEAATVLSALFEGMATLLHATKTG
jgi:hypothetical protein